MKKITKLIIRLIQKIRSKLGLQGSGSKTFTFKTLSDGTASKEASVYTAGYNLKCVGLITSPSGNTVYSGEVSTNAGSKHNFANMVEGEKTSSFVLDTELIEDTKFKISLSSTPPLPENTEIVISLSYTY